MFVLIKVSAIWLLLKREVHQENLTNYGKTTGRYVTISNSQSARRALWASSPQPIWAVAAGNRILRQRCWHKKSRKCISLQDHVNLYQDIKVLTIYCSIIGKPISGQDTFYLLHIKQKLLRQRHVPRSRITVRPFVCRSLCLLCAGVMQKIDDNQTWLRPLMDRVAANKKAEEK